MKREIKFRAWDKRKKEMVFDALEFELRLISYPDKRKTLSKKPPHIGYDNFEGQWFEIMQYTGLKDKNGVDIYEGDIISHPFTDGDWADSQVYQVKFMDGAFQIDKTELELGMRFTEVIGNIHENPELLIT